MKLFILLAVAAVAGGYFGWIPQMDWIADIPPLLMAAGGATLLMVFMLARLEP